MQRKTWYYEKWGGRQASFYRIWSVKESMLYKDMKSQEMFGPKWVMVHFRVILAIGRNGTKCPNLVETKICQVENICPDIGPTATPMPYLPDVIQLYGLYPGKMWQVFLLSFRSSTLETTQDFLIKLDIKPLMHLLKISIFSLNNDIIRLTKIMNNLLKHLQIRIFKVIFLCLKLVKSFQKKNSMKNIWLGDQLL